jgi:hypothetical protein
MGTLLSNEEENKEELANAVDVATNSEFSRNRRILIQQFMGLPPGKDLSVPRNEQRFLTICRPFKMLGFESKRVVYDRNTASVSGFHLPLFLDMVRDSAKNRLLNILSFVCIFCSVVLILSSYLFVPPEPPIPSKVRVLFVARAIATCSAPLFAHAPSSQIVVSASSTAIHTSCPLLPSSSDFSGVAAQAALLPCTMRVKLEVSTADGRPLANQPIAVSEVFPVPTFSVDSPFLPSSQVYVRGDGSSGSSACARLLCALLF